MALRTTGGGGSVGTSPWYIRWNKVDAPTCLLYTSGCMDFLLREASGIIMISTARLWMALSLPSDVSEAFIHTDETYSILDLTMLL